MDKRNEDLSIEERRILFGDPPPKPRPPRTNRSPDDLARDYTDDVIETFVDVMRDPLAEHRDRLRAAENLVDRGFGKPITPLAVQHSGKLSHQLADMTDEELYARMRADPLPRLAAPVMDAVVEELDPLLR